MTDARFIQIHWLASYPATLLNRDDAGLAKRMPFGGASRARISSQCLKRHWRCGGADTIEGAKAHPHALQNITLISDADFGRRSRHLFDGNIAGALIAEGLPGDRVTWATSLLKERLKLSKSKKGKKSDDLESEAERGSDEEQDDSFTESTTSSGAENLDKLLQTEQAFMLSVSEIDYLKSLVRRLVEGDAGLQKDIEAKPPKKGLSEWQKRTQKILQSKTTLAKNLAALGSATRIPYGIESALFGRMVTSDIFANIDGAIHVAHALTVHAIERELDFMTVVDDVKAAQEEADAGAAGVFDMELTSGLYYGYVVVDVPLLVSNLGGDAEIAAKVVEHLIHLIATVSPGAKKGSTAPYAWAEHMLVEAGDRQPRTAANAFRTPVGLKTNRLLDNAVDALANHLAKLDAMYGGGETRRVASVAEDVGSEGKLTLPALAQWASNAVRTGTAQ